MLTVVEPKTQTPAAGDVRPGALGDRQWTTHGVALLAAVVAGVIAQGGFYLPGRLAVAALVGVALLFALRVVPLSRADGGALAVACAALAAWAFGRSAVAGAPLAGAGWALSLACLAAGVMVVRRLAGPERARLVTAVVALAVGVAVTGWVGVAFRVPLWAIVVEHRFWRASSTLTYPNAAAAVLVVGALLALSRLAGRSSSVRWALAAFALVTGLGATLSRAGALAFLVGLGVLVAVAGVRVVWRTAPPLLGALVAVVGLAPVLPAAEPLRPGYPLAGLVVGAAVTAGLTMLGRRARLLALGAATLGALAWRPAALQARGTFASAGRGNATRAALDLVAERPLTGYGAGRAYLFWPTPDGRGGVARYVHDEYLQTLVDLGAVGLLLLVAVLVAAAAGMRAGSPLFAGAVAALAALAVHSAFDFLWQLAVVPVLGALLFGLSTVEIHRAPHEIGERE